jgi:putative ABC transport system permease protein
MSRWRLVRRSLTHHWRSHAAVVAGVACAVSVLTGALLVGGSVRRSLRELFLARLGQTDQVVGSPRFFREGLAENLAAQPAFADEFRGVAPLVVLEGLVTHEPSGRRASRVAVYGVDDRFWAFHGRRESLTGRTALASLPLARELQAAGGDALLVRVARPADVPGASLFGRRDDLGRTLRVTLERVLTLPELGEFSLRAQQQPVAAVFLPLGLLQDALDRQGQANTLLLAETRAGPEPTRRAPRLAALLRDAARLEDVGLRLRALPDRGALSLESAAGLLSDSIAASARAAAEKQGFRSEAILTYLANEIRVAGRSVPYSLVSALEPEALATLGAARWEAGSRPRLLLNDWAAGDLAASPGDTVTLEYPVWLEEGAFETRSAEFQLAGEVSLAGAAADPELAPEYPGITGSEHLSDWEPPFPVDLRRIRPKDEAYWQRHRTTPKAFVELAAGQQLWRHRLGSLTSIRFLPPPGRPLVDAEPTLRAVLAAALDPLELGLRVEDVRARGLDASRGATDFGEYFAYFSAFLVSSALLLAGLFFRLGIEQRLRELGLLRALGFPATRVLRLHMAEGLVLALAGSLLGLLGAWAYAAVMVLGLRTWWSDAVGTSDLHLHLDARALVVGGFAGIVTAGLVTATTLWGLRRVSPRALLSGTRAEPSRTAHGARRAAVAAGAALLAAAGLLATAATGFISATPAFFGAGLLLLGAALLLQWRWLLRGRAGRAPGRGVLWLALRNAAHQPGRSLLCIALIAFATFVIVAVGAFRRGGESEARERQGGTGGYALLAESLLPLHHDPNSAAGRQALGLGDSTLHGVTLARFRLRPGEDASCLNLYRPSDPRVLGATPEFVREGRFAFQQSLAASPEQHANPWLLLEQPAGDGAIPAVTDANSLTYVLHRKLGDELVIAPEGRVPVRLRFVASLRDSLFQGELLVAESRFLEAFPEADGYRVFLVDAPAERATNVTRALETDLADFGFDAVDAGERLAGFHRVENTYLATFETLGSLGLVLGTIGLGSVLLRNAFERRRELALLRAVGFRPDHLTLLVTAENALLLAAGLTTGTVCALIAIAPAVAARGGSFPALSLTGLLLAVVVAGLGASRLAAALVKRAPLLAALRSE